MLERSGGAPPAPPAAAPVPPTPCDASTLTEVRPHNTTRNPPVKPPRKSIPRKDVEILLTPIPEILSPLVCHIPHESDCLISPSFSPTYTSPEVSNSFFSQGMPSSFQPSPQMGSSYSPPGLGLPPSPSSPTGALGERADFEPAEFYIEESPPTSLPWASSPLEPQTLASMLQVEALMMHRLAPEHVAARQLNKSHVLLPTSLFKHLTLLQLPIIVLLRLIFYFDSLELLAL